MHLYLDIKTIPSQRPGLKDEIAAGIQPPGNISKAETIAAWEAEKKPALVDEAYAKTAFDGATGHVVSIAYVVDDGEVKGIGPGRLDHNWCAVPLKGHVPRYDDWLGIERERLEMAFDGMNRRLQEAANAAVQHPLGPGRGYVTRRPDGTMEECQAHIGPVTIVAHHAEHVVRFLYQRAVILGVKLPPWFPVNARPNHNWSGFGGPAVFDTMTWWAGYGGRISLDRLCDALGIAWSPAVDIAGDGHYERWLAGDTEAVWTLNGHDALRVRDVHRNLTFWAPPTVEPVQVVAETFPMVFPS